MAATIRSFLLCTVAVLSAPASAVVQGGRTVIPFTPGSVVALRFGPNPFSPTTFGGQEPLFLDEFSTAPATWGRLLQTIPLPANSSAAASFGLYPNQLPISGQTSQSQGGLKRSENGAFLSFAGWTANVSAASSPKVGVTVCVAFYDGTVDCSASSPVGGNTGPGGPGIGGDNIRSAVTNDGSNFWVAGTVGLAYVQRPGTGTCAVGAICNTLVQTLVNYRALKLYKDTLYGSGQGVKTTPSFSGVLTTGSFPNLCGPNDCCLLNTTTVWPATMQPTFVAATGLTPSGTATMGNTYDFAFIDDNSLLMIEDAAPSAGGGMRLYTRPNTFAPFALAPSFQVDIGFNAEQDVRWLDVTPCNVLNRRVITPNGGSTIVMAPALIGATGGPSTASGNGTGLWLMMYDEALSGIQPTFLAAGPLGAAYRGATFAPDFYNGGCPSPAQGTGAPYTGTPLATCIATGGGGGGGGGGATAIATALPSGSVGPVTSIGISYTGTLAIRVTNPPATLAAAAATPEFTSAVAFAIVTAAGGAARLPPAYVTVTGATVGTTTRRALAGGARAAQAVAVVNVAFVLAVPPAIYTSATRASWDAVIALVVPPSGTTPATLLASAVVGSAAALLGVPAASLAVTSVVATVGAPAAAAAAASTDNNAGPIAGGVVGGLAAVALVGAAAWYCGRSAGTKEGGRAAAAKGKALAAASWTPPPRAETANADVANPVRGASRAPLSFPPSTATL